MGYARLVRPLLFRLDAERAHDLMRPLLAGFGPAVRPLRRLLPAVDDPRLGRTVWGLRFPNPIGLAAGFDKQAECLDAWEGLGFGFVEVGTVTAQPQPGNPRPRLFRLPADAALVNRMGFNSQGAERVAGRLAAAGPRAIPLGVNIGKSRDVPVEAATADYEASFERLAPHADYVALNVSSPNTPGLRELQAPAALRALVGALVARSRRLPPGRAGRARPILVKLSPDVDATDLAAAVDAALEGGAEGFVATNTTVRRDGLARPTSEPGGLSGRPLFARALEVVAAVSRRTRGAVPIVAVGGVFGPDDARAMLDAGAALLQLYTGFVYGGPFTVSRICRGLLEGGAVAAPVRRGAGTRG